MCDFSSRVFRGSCFRFFLMVVVMLSLFDGKPVVAQKDRNISEKKAATTMFHERLERAGLSRTEISNSSPYLAKMLALGADEKLLVSTAEQLKEQRLKGRGISEALDSMSVLVESGDTPEDAADFMVEAVKSSRKRKLKGKNLVDRVRVLCMERVSAMK